MRADIHARRRDQEWDWQTRETEPPANKKKRAEKCGRSRSVAGWKRMIFRAETRSVPNRFAPDRWPGTATAVILMTTRRSSRQRARDEHGRKNTRPFFVAAPIGNHSQDETEHSMRGPIAPSADISHENFCGAVLMMCDPMLHLGIEIKCADERGGSDATNKSKRIQFFFVTAKFPVCLSRGAIFESRTRILQLR